MILTETPFKTTQTSREDVQPKKLKIPLSLEGIEAKKASFKHFQATKTWLEENFPKTFNFKEPKPLKVGIPHDLLSLTCPFSKGSSGHSLGVYVHSKAYLKSIVQENWRYDLKGEKVEEVTQEQKDHALKMLEHKKALLEKNKKPKLFRLKP